MKGLGKSNSSLVARFGGPVALGVLVAGQVIYGGRILWAKAFICMAKVMRCEL